MKLVFTKVASSKWSLGLFATLGLGLVTLFGEDLRHEFNQISNAGTRIEQRDLITYKGAQKYGAIISGRSIVDNGYVPSYPVLSSENLRIGNKYADWNADDAFGRAIRKVEGEIASALRQSAETSALMSKESWTPADCRAWDGAVVSVVSQSLEKVKGLQGYKYRTDDDPGAFRSFVTGEERGMRATPCLNDLSADMENGTYEKEYDCEAMSVIMTYLLQRTADNLLTPGQAPSYSYVYGSGSANSEEGAGVHAFVLSRQGADIVGVVESTEYTLRVPENDSFPLARFAAGEMIPCDQGAFYGLDFTVDDVTNLCLQRGDALFGDRLRHAQNQNNAPQSEAPPLQTPVITAYPPELVTMRR